MTLTQVKKKTGVSLSKLASKTAEIIVEFEEGDLNIVYYPSRITTSMIIQAEDIRASNDDVKSLVFSSEILSKIIKSWDLYEDEEQTEMFPLTKEKIQELPLDVLQKIIVDVMRAMNPEAIAPQG